MSYTLFVQTIYYTYLCSVKHVFEQLAFPDDTRHYEPLDFSRLLLNVQRLGLANLYPTEHAHNYHLYQGHYQSAQEDNYGLCHSCKNSVAFRYLIDSRLLFAFDFLCQHALEISLVSEMFLQTSGAKQHSIKYNRLIYLKSQTTHKS